MSDNTVKLFLKPKLKRKIKSPKSGDIVRVHQMIKEKSRERIQVFEGLVIAVKRPNSLESTFTVRRVSGGSAVERIFPLYSPNIKQIEKVSSIHSRQSKIYYLRDISKRIKKAKSEENGNGNSEVVNGISKDNKNQVKNKKDEKKDKQIPVNKN